MENAVGFLAIMLPIPLSIPPIPPPPPAAPVVRVAAFGTVPVTTPFASVLPAMALPPDKAFHAEVAMLDMLVPKADMAPENVPDAKMDPAPPAATVPAPHAPSAAPPV